MKRDYLHPLAAPSLPPIYSQAIEGLAIGPTVGSCGTAAWRGEPVFVADITTDPLWEPYRAAAAAGPSRLLVDADQGEERPRRRHLRVLFPRPARPDAAASQDRRRLREPVRAGDRAPRGEAHINRLAYYDHLTGLPNRGRLQRDIGKLIAAASARPQRVALVCIDIDHFKYVNDTLGHSSGDQLLVEVARRLAEHAGETIVGRMGGDEFLMALPDCNADRGQGRGHRAAEIALPAGDGRRHLAAAVGQHRRRIYPDDSADIDELLMNADVALYEAKRSGRGICKVFRPEMNARAEERMLLGAELKDALARGELDLRYQPQVRIGDGGVYGVEALTRWSHPSLGNITPDRFIPVAEEPV